MRVLIVDDEPAARRRLAIMLEELDVEVVGEAANGVQALEYVASRRPDVVLLDIAMREVSGLDVARMLPSPKPLVVFQTAHDEYAIQAFEQDAVDYLLKPVTLERLRQALERARARIESAKPFELSPELLERIRVAIAPAGAAAPVRVLLRDGDAYRLVPLREIARFSAEEGAVRAFGLGGARPPNSLMCEYSIAELEERVGRRFVRVSRSDLVNVEHVRKLSPAGDGSAVVALADGSEVRVSRRRVGGVRSALEG